MGIPNLGRRRLLRGGASLALLGTAWPRAGAAERRLSDIEARLGGRLGVAAIDVHGRRLATHRAEERFAMCSTFKAPLAALVLARAADGALALDERLAFERQDLVPYAPVIEAALAAGQASLDIATLAEAAVTLSDNVAANLLLRRIGGPAALTAFFRTHGDEVSRLDRVEPELNENAAGDPRDTTGPAAMARLMVRLSLGGGLPTTARERLNGWLVDTRTGLRRIRAGLPADWRAGDKTGTGTNAVNDVAVVWPPTGSPFALAIYVDRPTVEREAVEAAMADIAADIVARR